MILPVYKTYCFMEEFSLRELVLYDYNIKSLNVLIEISKIFLMNIKPTNYFWKNFKASSRIFDKIYRKFVKVLRKYS